MTEGRRKIFIRDAHIHTDTHTHTHAHTETRTRLMNNIKSVGSQQIEATIEQVEQKSAKQAQKLAKCASNLT